MAEGMTQGTQSNAAEPQQQQAQQLNTAAPEIDYTKLESILDKKIGVTESGVMKSFFKQQGLTEDEAKQAMEDFKTSRQAQQGNAQVELTQAQTQLQQAQAQLQQAAIEREVFTMAPDLGVDLKVLPYLTKLADFSAVTDEKGNINTELVKAAVEKVLTDVPNLKSQPAQSAGGFVVGADGGQGTQGAAQNEVLARIFGNKK